MRRTIRPGNRRALVAIGLVAFLPLQGCGSPESPPQPKAPVESGEAGRGPAGERTFKLVGVVRAVDRDAGILTIRHEDLPGFMPAMTMPFDVKGQPILEEVQVGDKVEGTLKVTPDDSKLTDVAITELAPPPEMVVDSVGGEATLRPRRPVLEPGQIVPDFAMTTQDGQGLRLSDLRGKVVALTFIYTRCPLPDYCPLMDRKFAEVASKLSLRPERTEDARLLSISFDPEHDTPEVLARHAGRVGAQPPLWTFAIAPHDELRKVAEELGLTYGPTGDEIVHTLSTAVIDREGRLVRLETGNAWDPADLLRTLNGLLRGVDGAQK